MESFEKAHVCSTFISKKDSKSEQSVKKQLKQMLDGYKHNDKELIKTSGNALSDIADVHEVLDDSSSVSGFSDLELTMSEEEDEVIAAVSSEVCDDNISSSSDINVSSENSVEGVGDINRNQRDFIKQNLVECASDCLEPISEGDEESRYLSEDTELDVPSLSKMSLIDLAESSSQLSSDQSISEEFDPDGSLASKILENLSAKRNTKSTKENVIDKKIKKNKSKRNLVKKSDQNGNTTQLEISSSSQDISNEVKSSPFISITAAEMSDESLSDILGDYKHPTVRNLPCEKQNIIPYVYNPGIFSIDEEIQIEDADSLIPEIDEDPIIEEIEMDLDATADTNIQPIDQPENDLLKSNINLVDVYYAKDSCIFVLKSPMELYVSGKVKIKPLGGTIEVFGHTLKKEVCLYAPNNSYAQCLKTVTTNNNYCGLFGKLTGSGLSVKEAEDIVTSLGEYDCVLSLSPLVNPRIDFIDDHFLVDLFNKSKVENTANRLSEASSKLGCNIYTSRPVRYFQECPEWEEAINCGLKEYSRGIVCGGKGVGKSTFIRYYLNKVLENGPVLVVDLDPGQAEFTVAGCISATIVNKPLLGPNYTHLKRPEISYNIGMINTLDNIFRYTSAVAKLIKYCQRNFLSMPWIVNTMGMTNNMGLKFILLIILCTEPTFLIQIDTKLMRKRFECYLEPDEIRILFEKNKSDRLFKGIMLPEDVDYNFILSTHVGGYNKQDTTLSPREGRYLNFLAYFGELMNSHSKNILGIVPYRINLADFNIATNVKVEKDEILKVINGKIVALCYLDTTDKGKVFTLGDNTPVCHGHGLIRGVEFENNVVYLITPEPLEKLSTVNTLVYSDWVPELQGTECHLPPGTQVPYRGTSHYSQHMRAPRRRFNPLQLLKMSRNT